MSSDQELNSFPATVIPLEDYYMVKSCAKHGGASPTGVEANSANIMLRLSEFNNAAFLANDMMDEPIKTKLGALGKKLTPLMGGLSGVIISETEKGGNLIDGLSDNRVCTILVCNRTNGELILDEAYVPYGLQTGEPYTKLSDREGTGFGNVPAPVTHGVKKHYGLGVYRFEKNLSKIWGFYGTGGALAFRSTDPTISNNRFAVSWLVPETGKQGSWVTSNLYRYGKGTLQEFYERTADKRKTDNRSYYRDDDGNKLAKMHGTMIWRDYPTKLDEHDKLLTVTIDAYSTRDS